MHVLYYTVCIALSALFHLPVYTEDLCMFFLRSSSWLHNILQYQHITIYLMSLQVIDIELFPIFTVLSTAPKERRKDRESEKEILECTNLQTNRRIFI